MSKVSISPRDKPKFNIGDIITNNSAFHGTITINPDL